MCSHFSILFSIPLAFLLFTRADSQIVQDPRKQPVAKWVELVSFFHPANITDNIRETPAVFSDFLDNLLTTNSHDAHLESQAAPIFLDGPSELRQCSFETLLVEEIGKMIQSFETVIDNTVTLAMALHDTLESASLDGVLSSDIPLSPLLKKLIELAAIAHDDLRAQFPLPATAPGHAERVKNVSNTLEHLQQFVLRLARNYEMEQEVIERHLARVIPFLHHVEVLVGDVVELYPAAIEALALHLSAVLLPEAVFLRSLVILYCFGPYVLGRDAIGGWLLKHVSEALRL